jgi:hypothetical protein
LLKTRGHIGRHLQMLRESLADADRRAKTVELVKQSREYLAKYAEQHGGFQAALAEYTKQMQPKPVSTDPVTALLGEMKAQEARSVLMRNRSDPSPLSNSP